MGHRRSGLCPPFPGLELWTDHIAVNNRAQVKGEGSAGIVAEVNWLMTVMGDGGCEEANGTALRFSRIRVTQFIA